MNQDQIIKKAMSILGKRMTEKRLKHLREVQIPLMRKANRPKKLNRAAVFDIRANANSYSDCVSLSKKYKVNVSSVIKTRDCKIHSSVKPKS